MFGRKGAEDIEHDTNTSSETTSQIASAPRAASPSLARRIVSSNGRSSSGEERKLTVGKGLSLAGEIASCDILVVEGKVEAKLSDGKLLEITESGQFRGNVEIENADIAGRYDGQLIVHGRLTVRATGRISGMVKYGELEVNAGGQIIGEMQIVGVGQQDQRAPAFKGVAKLSSSASEDDDAASRAAAELRKTA